jgi:hypothetical protein
VPDGHRLQVVTLSRAPTQVITMFDPHAEDSAQGIERIDQTKTPSGAFGASAASIARRTGVTPAYFVVQVASPLRA